MRRRTVSAQLAARHHVAARFIALFFAMTHYSDTFEDFCSNFDRTKEQKEKLKALGLETDS